MCDVDDEAVVAAVDAPSIYDIPKVLHAEGLDAYVVRRLGLPFRDVDWTDWDDLLRRVHHPAHEVTIALVGKYVDLPDAYLSVTEALARRRVRQRRPREHPLGDVRRLRHHRRRRAAAERRRRRLRAGWLRRPRHRGQAGRAALRTRAPDPHPRPVPRACSAWSSSSRARRATSPTRTRWSSTTRRRTR